MIVGPDSGARVYVRHLPLPEPNGALVAQGTYTAVLQPAQPSTIALTYPRVQAIVGSLRARLLAQQRLMAQCARTPASSRSNSAAATPHSGSAGDPAAGPTTSQSYPVLALSCDRTHTVNLLTCSEEEVYSLLHIQRPDGAQLHLASTTFDRSVEVPAWPFSAGDVLAINMAHPEGLATVLLACCANEMLQLQTPCELQYTSPNSSSKAVLTPGISSNYPHNLAAAGQNLLLRDMWAACGTLRAIVGRQPLDDTPVAPHDTKSARQAIRTVCQAICTAQPTAVDPPAPVEDTVFSPEIKTQILDMWGADSDDELPPPQQQQQQDGQGLGHHPNSRLNLAATFDLAAGAANNQGALADTAGTAQAGDGQVNGPTPGASLDAEARIAALTAALAEKEQLLARAQAAVPAGNPTGNPNGTTGPNVPGGPVGMEGVEHQHGAAGGTSPPPKVPRVGDAE